MAVCDCGPFIDSYGVENKNDEIDIKCDYPCGAGGRFCAVGQCFITPASPRYRPCEVTFNLRKVGNPSGWMWCKLYDITGTCGVDCVPNDDAFLCGTGGFNVSSLTTSWQLITFTIGSPCVCLLPNHCYAIVFVAWSGFGGINEEDYIQVGIRKLLNGGHAGNTVYYRDGAWGAQHLADTIFYLCGTECGVDEPDPVPGNPSTTKGLPREPYQEEVSSEFELQPYEEYQPDPEPMPLSFEKKQLEHKNILLHSGVGIPYHKIVHTTNIGLGYQETLPVKIKGSIGVRVFFETKVKSKVGIPIEETLKLKSPVGIPIEETVGVTKENLRTLLHSVRNQQVKLDDYWENFTGFVNTLTNQLKELNEKSDKKDIETKILIQNYLETIEAFIKKIEDEKTRKAKWLED